MSGNETHYLVGGTYAVLVVASVVTWLLRRLKDPRRQDPVINNLAARVQAWWAMVIIFTVALAVGKPGTVILFALTSFLALREFVTLTPTRAGDHRALFHAFFVVLPVQYFLIYVEW